jgi:hypothetical protein
MNGGFMKKEIYVSALILLLFLFFAGFHNADVCSNLIWLNVELKPYNVSYVENSLARVDMGAPLCYREGMAMMLGSGLMAFGICFINALHEKPA